MRLLPPQAMPILQALWRHRWLGVATAWLVCTAGWIGVAMVPTKYESSARVYLNADPLLTPLLRGLAADTDPGRHLDFMQRTLLSRPNLEQLVRLTDLDIGVTHARAEGSVVQAFGERYLGHAGQPELADLVLPRRGPGDGEECRPSAADDLRRERWPAAAEPRWTALNVFWIAKSPPIEISCAPPKSGGPTWLSNTRISFRTDPRMRARGDESLSRLDQARGDGRAHSNSSSPMRQPSGTHCKKNSLRCRAMLSVDRAPQVIVTGGRLIAD